MKAPMFTEFCVYTIVSRDKLDPIALDRVPLVNVEARTWKAAASMLDGAAAAGQSLPLLLADAKDCSRLLYWGVLRALKLGDKRTEYTVDYLRSLPGRHSPQELVLRSTGEYIAPGFIRPYAICFTPPFLKSTDARTSRWASSNSRSSGDDDRVPAQCRGSQKIRTGRI